MNNSCIRALPTCTFVKIIVFYRLNNTLDLSTCTCLFTLYITGTCTLNIILNNIHIYMYVYMYWLLLLGVCLLYRYTAIAFCCAF